MKPLTDDEFQKIRAYIKENFGINLSNEKKPMIYARLHNTLEKQGFEDFSQYFRFLAEDKSGEAVAEFINRVTTNHTFFMREPDHFDFLRTDILPYIEDKYGREKDLRLWCAAASSGEEPYTLEMICADYFANKPGWNTDILATDISSKALAKAAAGVYKTDSVKGLPAGWISRYLRDNGDGTFTVRDEIKNRVYFRKFNLMEERNPFRKPLQVIFCRNVMIYFDNNTKEALVNRLYKTLDNGGYLVVGHSETLNGISSGFAFVKPAVYRKN